MSRKHNKSKVEVMTEEKQDVIAETEVVKDEKQEEVVEAAKVSAEETVEPVKEKKKKDVKNNIVEEVLLKSNLPVYTSEQKIVEFMDIDDEDAKSMKRKIRKRKRDILQDLEKHQQNIIDDESAAYVQIINDKKNPQKIIRYNTNIEKGLSTDVVNHRKAQGLTNVKSTGSSKTIPMIIVTNVFTFFNLLNFAIAGWLIATCGAEAWKYIFFVVIVTANIVISTIQEIRSKLVIDKLSIMSAPTATILRDGDIYDIPVSEVVLDDILCLSSGKQIASDSILLEGSLEVNESLLTGESDSITKKPGDVLYSGSFVISGNCKARVERIGRDNYIEKLTSQAKKYRKPKSELLKTLTRIIQIVAIVIIPLGTMVFMSQWEGASCGGSESYIESVKTTAGAVIGMIPSGLFLLTSIALAVGVIRLAQHNTLVQELYCIEMLARVDVLCLDKTGTITDGSMVVKNVIEYNNDSQITVKNAFSAMQNALNDTNATSKALEEKFGRATRMKHVNIIPFNSTRKFSAVEFDKKGTFVLGAPEFVLTKNYNLVATDVAKAASNGYRMVCLAYSKGKIVEDKIEGEITPVALILIEDTIRPDAIETIEYFKQSGVEVKVISGDNPLTVSKISERAGIENASKYISLDGLTDQEVIRAASKYTVFGRVSPAQKKLLVITLKSLGKTVAMTGDGVNDILALKEADCSISLASGSEAARNASHLVLLDSNFNSMPKVVAEGRRVINNVQRVASLFLTKTIFSFLLAVYCIIIKKYPIYTNQLLLIDAFVTGIPSLILAMEPNNNKVTGKFLINVLKNAFPGALAIAFTTAVIFLLSRPEILNISEKELRTIIVLNATFTCFTVLFKVCRPFNVIRRVLFFTMSFFALSVALLIPNMLDISKILPFEVKYLDNVEQMSAIGILLLLCLVQITYPVIRFIENIKHWVKSLANYFTGVIRRIK